MNIKQLAAKLNRPISEVKEASQNIFKGKDIMTFNDSEIKQIENHFNNDTSKQLGQSQQQPQAESKNETGFNPQSVNRADRKSKLEENRIRSMQAQGQAEAIRDFQIKRSSYEETFDFLEIEYHNRENIESARARQRSRFIGENASEVNHVQQAQIIDVSQSIKMIEAEQVDLKMLLPASDATAQSQDIDLRDLI